MDIFYLVNSLHLETKKLSNIFLSNKVLCFYAIHLFLFVLSYGSYYKLNME